MLHRSYEARTRRHAWLWALLPLLLAAGLTVTALGRSVFDTDEAATMLGAGARHIGPYSPAEAVATFVSRWPNHAWGQVMAYSLWGRAAGWSELAIRALPWLAGLLTLAWVYRLGRDLFTARIALAATLLSGDVRPLSDLYARGKVLRGRDAFRGDCHLGLLARGPAPTPARTWIPGRPCAGRDRAVVLPLPGGAAAAGADVLSPVLRAQGAPLVAAGGFARPGRIARPATSA